MSGGGEAFSRSRASSRTALPLALLFSVALPFVLACGRSGEGGKPFSVVALRLPSNELYLGGLPVRADTVRIEWDGRGGMRINGVLIVSPPGEPGTGEGARGGPPGPSPRDVLHRKASTAYEEALLAGKSVRAATEAALLSWDAKERALLEEAPLGSEGIVEVRLSGGPRETWVLASEGDRAPRRFTRKQAEDLAARLAAALGEAGGPTLSVIGCETTFLAEGEEVRRAASQIRSASEGGTPADGPLPARELDLFRMRR